MSEETAFINLQPPDKPVPIVAIGGSAGALGAILEILENLSPTTGLAYVYIQHLSPTYESQLERILGDKTSMPVRQAQQETKIMPDHVYIIPPNKGLEVADGKLILTAREPKPAVNMPIDMFFASLSESQSDGAIGIVLSGMANDGTLGLKAIKEAGGITIVQDESAEYQSMPKSAIAEGVVDLVLSPKEIAKEIERLVQKADLFRLTTVSEEGQAEDTLGEDLKVITQFVKNTVGVDFDKYKVPTVRRRVIRRMLLYNLETLKDYINYLKLNPQEASILYNDLLINVTSFFRDPETMGYLKKELLPQIIKNNHGKGPIRIWVAACSTGQEAYSFAIMILEALGEQAGIVPVQIFASDLSDIAIAKARLGVYTLSEVADIYPGRLSRFFTEIDGQYRIRRMVRDMCVFAQHNLLKDPPFSRLDLVSCRNLLMYFDRAAQFKALTSFHFALNAGGFLLLGKSEAVGGAPSLFVQAEKNFRVFSRRNDSEHRIALELNEALLKKGIVPDVKRSFSASDPEMAANDLEKLVESRLLTRYVPTSVVVDKDLEIVQVRGSTGLFLEPSPGKPSFNLARMAWPSLVMELRNIIHKARKSGIAVVKTGLEVHVNEQLHFVQIEAVPLPGSIDRPLCLVIFQEVKANPSADNNSATSTNRRIKELEAELSALREDMRSIIEEQEAGKEELKAANEEVVSSNEELQSINEELQTSKEELESANEELLTINQELQGRNNQLLEAIGYSEVILSTIKEATLVLDRDLSIKSANQAFSRIFNTPVEEVQGKMFYEIEQHQWNIPSLRQKLTNVINEDYEIKGFEVTSKSGLLGEKITLLHAHKVVQHQRQEAILLVLEDVTEHRRAQRLIKERQEWFEDLVDNSPTLIWVSKANGDIGFLNKAWKEFTGQQTYPGILQSIHPADCQSYMAAFSQAFTQRKSIAFEYRLLRADGQYRWMLESAKPMYGHDGEFSCYMGSSIDMHLQKTLTQQLNQHVDERTKQLKEINLELESANQELTLAANRLQSVLNGVPAAITLMEEIIDPGTSEVIDFTTSVYNEPSLHLTGQTAQEITSQTLMQAHPNIKDIGLYALYLQVLNTGEPAYKEISGMRHPDDCLAFFITRKVDKKGIVVTVLDITERKAAEMKVTVTAESLQAVLDSSPGAIGFLKAIYASDGEPEDFRLVVYNQRFFKSFRSVLDKNSSRLASELFSEEQRLKMLQVLQTGKVDYEEKFHGDKWLGVSVTQHDHGVVVTELDITLIKQAEKQQLELIEQLEGSNETLASLERMRQYVRDRGEFLRSTSHDLRGSFGIIVGATNLLNIMDTEEGRSRTLEMIQRNLRQVITMMNQLLDYSRLESGQEQLVLTHFNAADLLYGLCESSVAVAKQSNLIIEFNGPQELMVHGDMVKIRRIAQNLILNAIKYTPAGIVEVAWGVYHQEQETKIWNWFLTVRDSGPGLHDALLAKLNVKSESLNMTAPEPGKELSLAAASTGEGLGLLIVRGLVELLGGSLSIESRPNDGTLFQIVFPGNYSE